MKILIHVFLTELFYVLTGAALIFVALEIIWPEIIIAYLNLNYVLIVWLFVGIIITYDKKG